MSITSVHSRTPNFIQTGAPLTQLPLEITLLVLLYLSGREVAQAKSVCQRFWKLINQETVWDRLFQRDFPGRILRSGIPASLQYQARYKTEQNWRLAHYRSQRVPTGGTSWSLTGQIALDDQRIICEGENSSLKVWNLQDAIFEQTLEGSPGNDLEYVINDGNLLISFETSYGGKLKVWNRTTGLCLWQHSCYSRLILDGNLLIGAVQEGPLPNQALVSLWDKYTGLLRGTLPAENINSATLILDGPHLIFGNHDGLIKIYHTSSTTLIRELKSEAGSRVSCLILNGEYLIAGYADGVILVWDKENGSVAKTLTSDLQDVSSLLVLQDLLIASYHLAIIGWDLNTELALFKIEDAAEVFPDGRLLFVSRSSSGTLEIRNSKDGTLVHSITDDHASVVQVDSHRVFTKSRNKTVKIWNKQDWSLCKQLLNVDYFTVLGDRAIQVSEGQLEIWDFSAC